MDLKPFFKPKTMAVIGLSLTNETHPANVIYNKNHLRQQVRVFGVNAKGGTIRGETVYQNISQIPARVDLAVIAVKAEFVADVMGQCIAAGTRGAVIVSGGFSETGRADLQERLVSMAEAAHFPFIGPNCLGIYSPPYLDSFFIPGERMVKPDRGAVAMVSQSGGILVDHMIKCASEGVGLSAAVSIGNKAYVKETDLMQYFADDPETRVIAFYVEGFGKREGREFAFAAGRCPKPVIVLKSGKTAEGGRAVSSHTASLAGDYRVFSSVMAQYGIVEAQDASELVAFAEVLVRYPKTVGNRVAIVTGSGGHGALAADECLRHGLVLADLSPGDQDELRSLISPTISGIATLANPIDLTGSSVDDDFVAAVSYLSRKPQVDTVVVLVLPYVPGETMDLGARLGMVHQQEGKPLIAYVPHVEKYRMLMEGFMLNNIPVARSVDNAIHMAEAMVRNRIC